MPSAPAAPDDFPAIGGYGFLSDCHTSALVTFDGTVEWLCLPRFDSPSVFAAVLDRGAGRLSLRPCGVVVPISRRYIPGTLVIETTWVTDTGWVVVHDALSIASWEPSWETSPTAMPVSPTSSIRPPAVDGAPDEAATTLGSSIAIGIKVSTPSTMKLTATENGSAYVPTTFSIIPSATSSGSAPGSTAANPSAGNPASSRSRRRRSSTPSL